MAALAAPAPAGEAPLAHPAPPPEPEAAAALAQARAKHVHRCVYTITFPHTDIAGARRPIEFSRQDFADLLASRHEEAFLGGNNTVKEIMVFKELHADGHRRRVCLCALRRESLWSL